MRPPICEHCGDRFDPEAGALLEFATSPAGEAWADRTARARTVGQSPDVAWFCPEHVSEAASLVALPLLEALDSMRTTDSALGQEASPAAAASPEQSARAARAGEVSCRAIDVASLHSVLRTQIAAVAEVLGIAEVPALQSTSERTWVPMDRAMPPNCPFTDRVRSTGSNDDVEVTLTLEQAFWNESELSNAHTSLHLRRTDGEAWSISSGAHSDDGRKAMVTTVHVSPPTAADDDGPMQQAHGLVIAAMDEAADAL